MINEAEALSPLHDLRLLGFHYLYKGHAHDSSFTSLFSQKSSLSCINPSPLPPLLLRLTSFPNYLHPKGMKHKPKLWYITTKIWSFLAVATSEHESQCHTGPAQCCNQSGSANDPIVAKELGLLGLDDAAIIPNTIVGFDCAAAIDDDDDIQCSSSLLCCEDNGFAGFIALGCRSLSDNPILQVQSI